MKESNFFVLLKDNQRILAVINAIIVCILLTLVVYSLVILGEHLRPEWDGIYLIIAGLLIALEAQISKRKVRDYEPPSRNWFLYRLSEWVLILLILKIIIYYLRGFGTLTQDISAWQENFIMNFFSGEYLIAVIVSVAIWGLATFFSGQLELLEGDKRLLDEELESQLAIRRNELRDSLAVVILITGILITAMSAFVFYDLKQRNLAESFTVFNVLHIVLFFVLGLVLLSLTQYSVLRVHWLVEKIPFQPKVTWQWFIYSVCFLVLIALAAMLLPTSYSVGLLEFLNILFSYIVYLLWLLAYIIFLPVLFLLSLLARLFGNNDNQEQMPFEMPPPKPPEPVVSGGGLADWIRSLIFWVIFLSIIIFSLVYFIRQNKNLLARIQGSVIFSRLQNIYFWIRSLFWGIKQELTSFANNQMQKFLSRQPGNGVPKMNYFAIRNLSARQKIKFYYLAMIRRVGEKGLPRDISQTPVEYSQLLSKNFPEIADESDYLTSQFLEAKYTKHKIPEEQAVMVKRIWGKIRKLLKGFVPG